MVWSVGSLWIKRVKRATSYVQNALQMLINPHSTLQALSYYPHFTAEGPEAQSLNDSSKDTDEACVRMRISQGQWWRPKRHHFPFTHEIQFNELCLECFYFENILSVSMNYKARGKKPGTWTKKYDRQIHWQC